MKDEGCGVRPLPTVDILYFIRYNILYINDIYINN